MKLYTPPKKQFLVLPNAVFDMPLDVSFIFVGSLALDRVR